MTFNEWLVKQQGVVETFNSDGDPRGLGRARGEGGRPQRFSEDELADLRRRYELATTADQHGRLPWGTAGDFTQQRRPGEEFDPAGTAYGDTPVGKEFVTIDGKEYARVGSSADGYERQGSRVINHPEWGNIIDAGEYRAAQETQRAHNARPSLNNFLTRMPLIGGLAISGAALGGAFAGIDAAGTAIPAGQSGLLSQLGIQNPFSSVPNLPTSGGTGAGDAPWASGVQRTTGAAGEALNQTGLEQMAADAGLSGPAADSFVASGGQLGSTAFGGGGIDSLLPPSTGSTGAAGAAADQAGLQQMGTAAGLSGPALQAFIASGGVLGSTMAGGGGVGTGGGSSGPATTPGSPLSRLLNGGSTPADLASLLGTLGATGLGVAGAMDQSNSIRDANATNAAALRAAQDRAMATLTESQRQALQSSGAGRDAAIAAYKAALAQSLGTSNTARDSSLAALVAGQGGALGANQDAQDKYFGVGDQYRDLLEASYKPGFSTSSIAGYDDAVNSSMNASMRALSTQGNPFDNPGGLMEANKYVTQNTALPAIQNYRSQLGQFGNQGLDTAGSAALQRPGIFNTFGQAQSSLLQNFGQFDANLTNQSGNNVANTYSQTGQNDANLIARMGQTGAAVLGATTNSVPTSNAGIFNALGYGLNQVTNPQPDLASLFNQFSTTARGASPPSQAQIDSTNRQLWASSNDHNGMPYDQWLRLRGG